MSRHPRPDWPLDRRAKRPMAQPWLVSVFALLAVGPMVAGCSNNASPEEEASHRWQATGALGMDGDALAVLDTGWIAASHGALVRSVDRGASWTALEAEGLPAGRIVALEAVDPAAGVLLAHVWAKGLYRSEDGGARWTATGPLQAQSLASAFLNPRLQYLPLDITADSLDPQRVYLAAPGGLFASADQGRTWSSLTASPAGKLSLLYTGVAARGDRLVVLSQAPTSLIPAQYTPFVGRGVLLSDDGGQSWQDLTEGLTATALTGVAFDETDGLYVASMDGGLYRREPAGDWTALGGPVDAVGCVWSEGAVSVASASRGVWRYDPLAQAWTQLGTEPTAALTARVALGTRGTVWALAEGEGNAPPADAGGTVHLALSFHANLYHSYRGDTNDEKGYGTDIRIMRATLDWLDAYPQVRGEWDIENAFSLDDVLPREAPDIIARIKARVEANTGAVRIMSWNNGALAAQTREEFDASVSRAQRSLEEAFGTIVPGVQPQECMFSPDHVAWYAAHGIEWITLFASATPFTALRHELREVLPDAAYQPLRLTEGDAALTLVPTYHHADILDHGGLAAWARQISAQTPGDSLLVIHMDADSEFWVKFDEELAALQGLPFVRYTTIQEYLDNHPATVPVSIEGDLADGAQDGFQSWAEKAFNHEIATGIARARETAQRAAVLGEGDAQVAALLDDALSPRLLALSTTHFGLAAPYLVEERVDAARARTEEANVTAEAALAAAAAAHPVAPGAFQLLNAQAEAGLGLVSASVTLPAGSYAGPEPLAVLDGQGQELPVTVDVVDAAADPVVLTVTFVRALTARGAETLAWRYDPAQPSLARGSLTAANLTVPAALRPPFTECLGARAEGQLDGEPTTTVDPRGSRVQRVERYTLKLCDGEGTVTRTLSAFEELPGTVVVVDARIGEASSPKDAESVALTPLGCSGPAETITWRTFGGNVRTTTPRPLQESQNNWAADGWVALSCDGGARVQVSHQVTARTSMAFAPLRTDGTEAVLAPLGTLWGDGPFHDSRRTGGLGHGGIVTWMVAPQFRPSAPDWSGQQVHYQLLVGEDLPDETLTLFAHPPLVRVGAE